MNRLMPRREFYRQSMRWLIGGAICALGSALASRRPSNPGGVSSCHNRGVCRGCGVNGRCGLPRAVTFRRARARKQTRESANESEV